MRRRIAHGLIGVTMLAIGQTGAQMTLTAPEYQPAWQAVMWIATLASLGFIGLALRDWWRGEPAKVRPEPNMPIEEVVKRICRLDALAPNDGDGLVAIVRACDELREKGLLGTITIFGGINWRTTPPAGYDRMTREAIPKEFWRDHRIEVTGFLGEDVGDRRGRTQHISGALVNADEYYSLWFDEAEIDALWPPSIVA